MITKVTYPPVESGVIDSTSHRMPLADAGSRRDNFYHWGALPGFIGMMENGDVPSPGIPLGGKK